MRDSEYFVECRIIVTVPVNKPSPRLDLSSRARSDIRDMRSGLTSTRRVNSSRLRKASIRTAHARFAVATDPDKSDPTDPRRRHRRARCGVLAQTVPWGSQSAAGHTRLRHRSRWHIQPPHLSEQILVVTDALKKISYQARLGAAAGDRSGRKRLIKRGLRHG